MRSVSYIFLVLIGITVFCSCKGNKGSANNSPALIATPELKNITEKINDNPKDAALYFQRGTILHRLQEDTLALNDFKQATKLDSTKAEYFSAVGDLMFEHKDVTGSVKWLQKALDLNPGDKKAQLKVAKMFVYIKEYSSAFKAINTVLRQDVYNPEAYFLKGMIYKDLKDTAKAISSFQTAVQVAPDYKEAVLQLGSIYSSRGNPIALTYFQNAWKLDTTDAFPLFARGVYYQHRNELELAKEEYRNVIMRDRQYIDAYFNIAYVYMQQDSLDKAMRQYDILVQIDQSDPEAYYNRGVCFEKMGKKQEAINDYKQALVFDDKYQPAHDALVRIGG